VKIPFPRLVEFTVTTENAPTQIGVVAVALKLLMFGFPFTTTFAALPVETLLLQFKAF
jgi:hypothetical protein